jgi:TolB protein
MKAWLPLSLLLLQALAVRAEERPPIVITDPGAKSYRAAVQRFARLGEDAEPGAVAALRRAVEEGLALSNLFSPIQTAAFLGPVDSAPLAEDTTVVCENWSQIGSDALVRGELALGTAALRVEYEVIDVSRGCRRLLRKRYRGAPEDLPRVGRAIADDVVGAFTGTPGVSDTEIAFVSNRSGTKEVWVMDADGGNQRAVTQNRSINSFPSWDPDGESIVYTSYRYRQRPHIFLLTRGRRSPGRILRELDPAYPLYRAVFAPEGQKLAVVMSPNGAAEIYRALPDGGALQRLTKNLSIDVAPSWSPDGERIAFVSDRSGSPQIYVMDSDGGDARRITFNGSYNSGPAWSPDGRWIAYESRVGSQFDIWLIDPEGQVNLPLVSNPRSDEHPTWSPDGRMLAFTSTRRGRADIYVSDLTGKNLRRLTQGEGDDVNPAWGPYRR